MKAPRAIAGPHGPLLPLLLFAAVCTNCYKPVIIVHGIFDGPQQFRNLSAFIKQVHPGTEVTVIDLYDNLKSVNPLWKQVPAFREAIISIMKKAPDGVHLLCFSQGGLLCRAILSTTPSHNVHSFISLSSPLAGQYGETEYLNKIFCNPIKKELHYVCYNKLGQKFSVCDYWNDPHYRCAYLQKNEFLPLVNGEKSHNNMKEWKENFLRIKKLVLIGGPDDGVITPWESSHFGFYDSKENVVEMRNQEFYKNDTFGLKTLDARGDVSVCIQPGVKHVTWHSNFTVFRTCMEKWLT